MRHLALLSALFGLSGCIIYAADTASPSAQQPGDVLLKWTFANRSCLQTPEVAKVQVVIPGELLQDVGMGPGVYPCSTAGVDGIRLLNFAGGSYQYSMDAFDGNGARRYTTTGNVTVNRDVVANVNLSPLGLGPQSVTLYWTFAGQTCAKAGVTQVRVSLGTLPPQELPCTQQSSSGAWVDGITINGLDQQLYPLRLDGKDANGYYPYALITGIGTGSVGRGAYSLDLKDAYGSLVIKWQLGSSNASCAGAGVDNITVDIKDSQGRAVNLTGNPAQPSPIWACSSGQSQLSLYGADHTLGPDLVADYQLTVYGWRNGSSVSVATGTVSSLTLKAGLPTIQPVILY